MCFSLNQTLQPLIRTFKSILSIGRLLFDGTQLTDFIGVNYLFGFRLHFLKELERFMHLLVHLMLHPLHILEWVFILLFSAISLFKFLVTTFHAGAFSRTSARFWISWERCEHAHCWHHHWHWIHWSLKTHEAKMLIAHIKMPILLIDPFQTAVALFCCGFLLFFFQKFLFIFLNGFLWNLFALCFFLRIIDNIVSDIIDIICAITLTWNIHWGDWS